MADLARCCGHIQPIKVVETMMQDFGKPSSVELFLPLVLLLVFSLCLVIRQGMKPGGQADSSPQQCTELPPEDQGKLRPPIRDDVHEDAMELK